MRIQSLFHGVIVFLLLTCSFVLGIVFFIAHNKCIDFSVLEHYNPGRPSIVLDDEGKEWTRFQLDRREPIKLDQMPQHLINAFIIAEDRDFFNHGGISYKGIIRSMMVNLYHGRIVQGASTITQQLVKLLFFDAQKTFKRKLKEQFFALLVEHQFTKEQILETYLNHVYFGCGIYGVEAASQRFWGKHAYEITLDESAVLASIVRSPGNYCPIIYPLSAQKRRDVILHLMYKGSFITYDEYECARASSIKINDKERAVLAPHLKETMRVFLEGVVGKEKLYSGGLTIQTTLNQKMQKSAEYFFNRQCALLRKELMPEIDGALISIDVKTGEIKALIGGMDFSTSKFNRALQAKRQLGSIFKTVVYAAAIESGMSFADTEIDEPFELVQNNDEWRPRNWDHTFAGQITLAYALYRSNNIVAIKTFLKVGSEKIIALAKKLRLSGSFHPYPSLALGCVDASLKEAVGMFNIFAHNGVYVEPHYLKWIKNRWGAKIWKNRPFQSRVLNSHVSDQVAKVLGLGLERIHTLLYPHRWFDAEGISKTGTTNEGRTCWFIGATPTITTGVYIGCDDNRPMGNNVYPIRTAFPIWKEFTCSFSYSKKKFTYDPSLKEILIHEKTGEILYNSKNPEAITILC